MISLILNLYDIRSFKDDWFTKSFELVILKTTVSTTINSSNYSNQFFICSFVALKAHEGVDLWMADVTLLLAVNQVERCSVVPVWQFTDHPLEHL